MVRERGFEPPWYCYRQPLKLVRLPVPPLPHSPDGWAEQIVTEAVISWARSARASAAPRERPEPTAKPEQAP
jgi:hypothetical protein